jgi:hypothetical protein
MNFVVASTGGSSSSSSGGGRFYVHFFQLEKGQTEKLSW